MAPAPRGIVRKRTKYVNGKILPYDMAMDDDFSACDVDSINSSIRDQSATVRHDPEEMSKI